MGYVGQLELATSRRVKGWAARFSRAPLSLRKSYDPTSVEVSLNGNLVATLDCREHREELAVAGIGDGRFGFEFEFPDGLLSAEEKRRGTHNHKVAVRFGPSGKLLRSGKTVVRSSNYAGWVDFVDHRAVRGWAVDRADFGRCVDVEILIDGRVVATVPANRVRGDIEHDGKRFEHGSGFMYRYAMNDLAEEGSEVLVRIAGASKVLPGKRGRASPRRPDVGVDHCIADTPVDLGSLPGFRSDVFPDSGPAPWLDRPAAEDAVQAKLEAGDISTKEAALCRRWITDGYVVLDDVYDPEFLERVWTAYEEGMHSGQVRSNDPPESEDPYPGRCLDPHLELPEAAEMLRHPRLLHYCRLLLGREIVPFQSIFSHRGSQQLAHSDFVHMSSYPRGYLCAAFVAFENLGEECGPLQIWPGSHRLPYLCAGDLGIHGLDGYVDYHRLYEPATQALIEREGLKPKRFTARRGEVLLWHHNLLHGGSERVNPALSRRSAVFHLFADGAICYHDYDGQLARIHFTS